MNTNFISSCRNGLFNKIISILFLISLFFVGMFANEAFASDYKYKVLDPKYNPSIEKYLDKETGLPVVQDYEPIKKKGFDGIRFLALLVVFALPVGVICLIMKLCASVSVKNVSTSVTSSINTKETKNISQQTKTQVQTKTNKKIITPKANPQTVQTNPIQQVSKTVEKSEEALQSIQNMPTNPAVSKIKEIITAKDNSNVTQPIVNKNPMLLNTVALKENKGLCLVEYNQKYSLIGYIENQIFLLSQLDKIQNSEIRPRLSEIVNNKERYIVRLGTYKALVEVDENKMDLLIEL